MPRRLRLSAREHTVFVAKSQEFKTTLSKQLIQAMPANTIVIDTKRQDFGEMGWMVSDDPRAILENKRLIWQPPLAAVHRWRSDWKDPFSLGLHYIWTVRARGGVLVLIDEAKHVAPRNPHPLIALMVTQGMGRGVGVWGGMQSPFGVFQELLNSAMHFFLGRLGNKMARGVLQANLEVEVERPLAQLKRHQFLYLESGWDAPAGPLTVGDLKLKKVR